MSKITRKIYTVSELNALARAILDDAFQVIWVSGEISNLVKPVSGHIYFTLKDEKAQIRCAMFRGCNYGLKFDPKNGEHVTVAAGVGIYEARGDYQLVVQSMELAGDGFLHAKFLQLKEKLAKAGLFDIEHKKPLPKLPQKIGVVTSSTGAAICDILSVLKRRFPSVPVIIYPTMVQGAEAAAQIAQAIAVANTFEECEVLILARGGGSLEDLWPFNEEVVARAIFQSKIPVVTGVGHEVDFTIADLVADRRAPTPSAAAELIVPDVNECLDKVNFLARKLDDLLGYKLHHLQNMLLHLKQRLRHPLSLLQQQAQRLDDFTQRLEFSMRQFLRHRQVQIKDCMAKLAQQSPLNLIEKYRHKNSLLVERLKFAIWQILQQQQQQLCGLGKALAAINPLATLKRGYAIISRDNAVVYDAAKVNKNDRVRVRLAIGELECIVEEIVYD